MCCLACAVVVSSLFHADPAQQSMLVGTARFEPTLSVQVDGKEVSLRLTGAAMRRKLALDFYALGSYVRSDAKLASAEELIAADVPKRLTLKLQRDLAGSLMASSFRDSIRANNPEPAFKSEIELLMDKLRSGTSRKGDEVCLTHLPGRGLHVRVADREDFLIENPRFSAAIWQIYLGPKNLGEALKKAILDRL